MIKPHDNTIQDMQREITELRALLAEQTARAERVQQLYAQAMLDVAASEVKAEHALAACAEMRAALVHIRERVASSIGEDESNALDICDAIERIVGSALGEGDPLTGDLPRRALIRTDLGAGMVVVSREALENLIKYAREDMMQTPGSTRLARAFTRLAALLDGGKAGG